METDMAGVRFELRPANDPSCREAFGRATNVAEVIHPVTTLYVSYLLCKLHVFIMYTERWFMAVSNLLYPVVSGVIVW
jgi:hypothetical protein